MSADRINQSPSVSPQTTMTFAAAMAFVAVGKMITKLEWDNTDDYGMLRDNWLMIHRAGKWHRWLLNDGDIMGDDWILKI